MSAAPAPWRQARAVHDPGKIVLAAALAVALGGGCLADADVASPYAVQPSGSRPAWFR
jgi:hypothetical protein